MSDIRAKKGGEIGDNGFWYGGGQFLPSTRMPKMTRRLMCVGNAPVLNPDWKPEARTESKVDSAVMDELMTELGRLLENTQIPSARRPGGDMFDARWIVRNAMPAIDRNSRAFEILKKLW